MFCSNCGSQQTQGARFCSRCGNPLDSPLPRRAPRAPAPDKEVPEMTLWEGGSHDTANLASGGGMVRAKYQLTTRMLYFQRGNLSTRTEQVPLWAIRDVTIRQTMTQRKRGVGTIRVWVEHADFAGRVHVSLVDVDQPAVVWDLINQHAQYERLAYERRKQTRVNT